MARIVGPGLHLDDATFGETKPRADNLVMIKFSPHLYFH